MADPAMRPEGACDSAKVLFERYLRLPEKATRFAAELAACTLWRHQTNQKFSSASGVPGHSAHAGEGERTSC